MNAVALVLIVAKGNPNLTNARFDSQEQVAGQLDEGGRPNKEPLLGKEGFRPADIEITWNQSSRAQHLALRQFCLRVEHHNRSGSAPVRVFQPVQASCRNKLESPFPFALAKFQISKYCRDAGGDRFAKSFANLSIHSKIVG